MILFNSFYFASNGLFDFDLTFVLQAFLFFFFSYIVTTFFLIPISDTLKKRSYIVNFTNQKSVIYLTLLFEKIFFSLNFFKKQKLEIARELKNFDTSLQLKIVLENKIFEDNISFFFKNTEKLFFYKSIYIISYLANSIEQILEKKIKN